MRVCQIGPPNLFWLKNSKTTNFVTVEALLDVVVATAAVAVFAAVSPVVACSSVAFLFAVAAGPVPFAFATAKRSVLDHFVQASPVLDSIDPTVIAGPASPVVVVVVVAVVVAVVDQSSAAASRLACSSAKVSSATGMLIEAHSLFLFLSLPHLADPTRQAQASTTRLAAVPWPEDEEVQALLGRGRGGRRC